MAVDASSASDRRRGRNLSIVGCRECVYQRQCGGLDQQQELYGCFTTCVNCDPEQCDWTCPNSSLPRFHRRWSEVGGLHQGPPGPLKPLSKDVPLPEYIPIVQHGSSRLGGFSAPVVAVPMHKILGRKGKVYGTLVNSPEELRRRFGIASSAKVMVISVAEDPKIEQYWRYAREARIGEDILRLDVLGMTVPNFSSYDDAPRTQTLLNRYRMMRSAEALSDSGVPIIPHLNAVTENDWLFWAELLRSQPSIRFVAKEFHTGLAPWDRGLQAVQELIALQKRVARDLHPIVIAGARFSRELARHFKAFTIADSVPFSHTVMGRCRAIIRPDRSLEWRLERTLPKEPLDDRLKYNFAAYRDWLAGHRQIDDLQSGRQSTLPFWSEAMSQDEG